MKSVILAATFTAFAGLCAAQTQASLPDCAQKCVVKFTSGGNIGGCQSQDIACICSAPTFLSDIACCLASACDADDQKEATTFAKDYCELVGVTNLPSSVVCSSTTTGGTPTATAGGSTSTSTSVSVSVSNGSSTTPAPSAAAGTASSAAATSTPNAGAQNNAAGVGAGFGMLALAALL